MEAGYMAKKLKIISANVDDLYTYRVKPLLEKCNINFFRVNPYYPRWQVSDVYFFTEDFSGWISLKAIDEDLFKGGKAIKPEWKRGEMAFLKSIIVAGLNVVVIIELRKRVFYTWEVKTKYQMSDLSPFTPEEFFV
jgi:hypothetical protein